ncbi:hypothetical protein A6R68_14459, partial [Neotoma lepida]
MPLGEEHLSQQHDMKRVMPDSTLLCLYCGLIAFTDCPYIQALVAEIDHHS